MTDVNKPAREPRRKAEFIQPPNTLKAKAGSGGLDEAVIDKAQSVIDNAEVDFLPIGKRYLTALKEGIQMAENQRGTIEDETLIIAMIYPAMQLKANGGMFGYPLITAVAARLIRFLEYVHEPNADAMDIINGFTESIQAIMLMGEKTEQVTEHGSELYSALDDACERFFEKYGI